MSDERQKSPETPSFKIRDRRGTTPEGAPEEEGAEAAPPPPGREAQDLPEIDFATFLFSLSTSALVHMGEVADPGGGAVPQDLPLAKQTIDIIGMLKEKTRGNLSPEESNLLDNLLYDLRVRYVQKISGKK
jgi:hypothetical protein